MLRAFCLDIHGAGSTDVQKVLPSLLCRNEVCAVGLGVPRPNRESLILLLWYQDPRDVLKYLPQARKRNNGVYIQ
jgi:hypothetical protein